MDARKVVIPQRILSKINWTVRYSPYPLFEVVSEVMSAWGQHVFAEMPVGPEKSAQVAKLRSRITAIVERTASKFKARSLGRMKSKTSGVFYCTRCHCEILSRCCLQCDIRDGVAMAIDLGQTKEFFYVEPRELNEPTEFPPGSKGKIEVLAARLEAGLILWHPDDCKTQPDVKPKYGISRLQAALMVAERAPRQRKNCGVEPASKEADYGY